MIYTVTLNPSLDYYLSLDNFNLGEVNRSTKEITLPGGKGINVSILLNNIGVDSVALGFIGGEIGDLLLSELNKYKYIKQNFIREKENTRINIILQTLVETRVNANGPKISDENYTTLINQVQMIKENDIVILSGSLPSSIKKDLYGDIAKVVKDKKGTLVVDTTKEKLLNLLQYKPFLIKPNKNELEEVFNIKITGEKAIIKYAKILKEKGAENVLVSLGSEGAILVTEDKIYRSNIVEGTVINTVGAGDSMLAGFIAMYLKTASFTDSLRFGTSCGVATAYSMGIGEMDLINKVDKNIFVKEIF